MKWDISQAHKALRWTRDGGAPTVLGDIRSVIAERRDGSFPVGWTNLRRSDSNELRALAPALHLDDAALEDLQADRERPKLDVGDDVAVIVTRWVHFDTDSGRLLSQPVSAVISDGVVVTLIEEEEFLAKFGKRVYRHSSVSAGTLLYELMDLLIDGYSDAVDDIADVVDELSERIFDESPLNRDEQRRIFQLRRSLTRLRRLVMPMQDISSSLMNAARAEPGSDEADWIATQLAPEVARGFADVADHALHVAEGVDGLRDVMASLADTNLSLADVQLNTVMKKLASWAAIIAVPTLITGFLGMNVPYPGYGTGWGVLWAVLLIMISVSLLIWTFRRRGWL